MSEVFFILTTVFVAYVVYSVVNDQKAPAKAAPQPLKSDKPEAVVMAKKEAASKTVTKAEKAPVSKAQDVGKGELRNPKTGEVSSAHSNYRFTKRWIKEALVEEGLVEKIFKNNELDEAVEAKIKDALVKLESMAKYKA
jgi:hypothetical protein